MSANPFAIASQINAPLGTELCQEIHFAALRTVAREPEAGALPPSLSPDKYRLRARLEGPSAYLAHPADIERIFAGVTLEVYRAIETLYCRRIGRGIAMVWRILQAMAERACVPVVDYEAVWAICLYLARRRAESCAVMTEHTGITWCVGVIIPDVRVRDDAGATYRPSVACVVDVIRGPEHGEGRVIAFTVAGERAGEGDVAAVIYQAIVAGRQPDRNGGAGLRWTLPRGLVSEAVISPDCLTVCADLGIKVSSPEGARLCWLRWVETGHATWPGEPWGRTALLPCSTPTCTTSVGTVRYVAARTTTGSPHTWWATTEIRPGNSPRCGASCRDRLWWTPLSRHWGGAL